jgi:hypothetical protein
MITINIHEKECSNSYRTVNDIPEGFTQFVISMMLQTGMKFMVLDDACIHIETDEENVHNIAS